MEENIETKSEHKTQQEQAKQLKSEETKQLKAEEAKQRRVVNSECRRMIANVYHFLKKEYDFTKQHLKVKCDLSHLRNIAKRTAEATGVSVRTVERVLKEEKALPTPTSSFIPPMSRRKKRKTKVDVDSTTAELIRSIIQKFCFEHKTPPSLSKLRTALKEKTTYDASSSTLRSTLLKMGYKWEKVEKRMVLIEKRETKKGKRKSIVNEEPKIFVSDQKNPDDFVNEQIKADNFLFATEIAENPIFEPNKPENIVYEPNKPENIVYAPNKPVRLVHEPKEPESIVYEPQKTGSLLYEPKKPEYFVFEPKAPHNFPFEAKKMDAVSYHLKKPESPVYDEKTQSKLWNFKMHDHPNYPFHQ